MKASTLVLILFLANVFAAALNLHIGFVDESLINFSTGIFNTIVAGFILLVYRLMTEFD